MNVCSKSACEQSPSWPPSTALSNTTDMIQFFLHTSFPQPWAADYSVVVGFPINACEVSFLCLKGFFFSFIICCVKLWCFVMTILGVLRLYSSPSSSWPSSSDPSPFHISVVFGCFSSILHLSEDICFVLLNVAIPQAHQFSCKCHNFVLGDSTIPLSMFVETYLYMWYFPYPFIELGTTGCSP